MDPHSQFAPRVLLAVDDVRLRRTSEAGLRAAGFSVSAPTDAEAAEILADSFAPDVVVVDTSLHAADQRPLYQHLRTRSDRYLLCIEPAGRDRARVEVLRSGADDAVSMPVSPDELAARCHALLRRPRDRRDDFEAAPPSVVTFGPLTVDSGRHEIRLDGETVAATRIEFSLLEHLCHRPSEVCSRRELLDSVWGPNWVGDDHVVDVHLSNLRRKLDQAAPGHRVIHTVRGVGFRLDNDILDAAEPAPEPLTEEIGTASEHPTPNLIGSSNGDAVGTQSNGDAAGTRSNGDPGSLQPNEGVVLAGMANDGGRGRGGL